MTLKVNDKMLIAKVATQTEGNYKTTKASEKTSA